MSSIWSPEHILSQDSRDRSVKIFKNIPTILYEKPTGKAAVLIPLCIVDGEVHILYTLRSRNLNSHGGQVCFPGGKSDGGETAIEAALREAEEELGVSRDNIDIWTEMSPVQGTRQAIVITPVIGVIKIFRQTLLNPNPNEVEEVFTVPLKHLSDPVNQGFVHFTYKKAKVPVPVYIYENFKIWGVTAIITHMFLLNFLSDDMYQLQMSKQYDIDELMPSKL